MRIYKYPLRPLDEDRTILPQGAKVLCAQIQNETICLWAEVDPAAPPSKRRVRVLGTGHDLPDLTGFSYVDTVQFVPQGLVLHIYVED